MRKHFLWMMYFMLPVMAMAHPGGHYKPGDGTPFHHWTLQSGKEVKGNFLMFQDNTIWVEREKGVVQPLKLDDLCKEDQAFALVHILKIVRSNFIENPPAVPTASKPFEKPMVQMPWFGLLYLLASVFFFVMLTQLTGRYQRWKVSYVLSCFLGYLVLLACSKSKTTTPTAAADVIPKTSVGFIDSAFSAFKPPLTTSSDATYYYVASNGFPNHNMMVGITSWQQQVPITQSYSGSNSWSIPLQPVYASVPLSTKTNLMKGAVALAVNGIPIFNALNNRGEDSYRIGELDNWGGHCGRADDYHYHAAPLHLETINQLKPIAFALDGFAVYGSKEPDGTAMTTLDTCHGHKIGQYVYHYHGTSNYPYVVGAMRGKVALDPATPAPENQILPQAFARGTRPATTPLNGAQITDFVKQGDNGYLLTYRIGTKNGYVQYSWDASNKYTFRLTDTSGAATVNVYQR
jgi:hypothetical protein